MKPTKKKVSQYQALISSHEASLFESVTKHLDKDPYFAQHFKDLPDDELEALYEFLFELHDHGLIGGMHIMEAHTTSNGGRAS